VGKAFQGAYIAQQENDGNDIILIVDRLNKKLKKDVNARFGTVGFADAYKPDSCFFFTYPCSPRSKSLSLNIE